MDKKPIIEKLRIIFPNARIGFIEVLVDALELHDKKNHDYNGANRETPHNQFELLSKFYDIRRKYSRLYHIIAENKEPQVDEKLEDTVIDLANYAILLAEYIKEEK